MKGIYGDDNDDDNEDSDNSDNNTFLQQLLTDLKVSSLITYSIQN